MNECAEEGQQQFTRPNDCYEQRENVDLRLYCFDINFGRAALE
jgi:hypothetical protein